LKATWAEQTDAKERAVDVHVETLRDVLRPFDTMIEMV
jgi:DNA-binding response OmpR family regulator